MRERLARLRAISASPNCAQFGGTFFACIRARHCARSQCVSHGWHVTSAWCEVQVSALANVESQAKSRLLDFLLLVRKKVGRSATGSELRQKIAEFDTRSAFEKAIFAGPTNIIVGHSAAQNINQVIRQNDWEGLVYVLQQSGLPDTEIASLKKAIDSDRANGAPTAFDGETGRWYTGLLAKVGKGTVKIGTSVVTSVISAALLQYFGMGSTS
jgi:hypothetical protein